MDRIPRFGGHRISRHREIVLITRCIVGLELLAGCNDRTDVTRPPISSRVPASFSTTPSGPSVSTISFDLGVENARPGAPSKGVRAHVDRAATAGGWRTTITLIDDPRAARLPSVPWRPKQLVIDESGHLTIHRADGQVAATPDPSRLLRPTGAAVQSRATDDVDVVLGTHWADAVLQSSDSRAKKAAAMIAGASAAGRDAQGLDHYTRVVGSRATDVSVDPATGVIRGIVLSDGQRTSRATFQYLSTASGLSIQTRSQLEDIGGKFPGTRTVTVEHITIDGKEVVP